MSTRYNLPDGRFVQVRVPQGYGPGMRLGIAIPPALFATGNVSTSPKTSGW